MRPYAQRMITPQCVALSLYVLGAVFAIAGPLIGAVRLIRKYRASKSDTVGTYGYFDEQFDAANIRATALRDATWGFAEFSFVALGVVLASVASIILIVPA